MNRYAEVNIYSNTFSNILIGGRFAAVHLGENDQDLQNQTVHVYSNTFQLGPGGNGVVCASAINCDVHDNVVSCIAGDCSNVGYFAQTQVPSPYYGTSGTMLTLNDNDVSALTAASRVADFACAGSQCAAGVGSTTLSFCASGLASGSGALITSCPRKKPKK
jgi:hypothetical protein